jgi:HSP20 family protein
MSEQILDEKGSSLRVVVEMPGVEKGDIQINAGEDSVGVKAERGPRKYGTEVALKARVDPDTGKAEFRNGVLEISFSLKDKPNKAYRRVNVV